MKKFKLKGELKSGRVWLDGEELFPDESQALIDHSSNGFAWGYGGSGTAQLALAICLKLYPKHVALKDHQTFKWEFIAPLPQTDFETEIEPVIP